MDIVARAKNILVSSKAEWRVIAAEPTDVAGLYTGYIMPLAAIPAVCSFLGMWIIGIMGFHVGFFGGLTGAILHYVLGLAAVYVAALVASKLAPTFGGQDNIVQALKLIAFSATASWVGGVFGLIPALGILSLLMSIYSLYLLFTGAALVMNVPEDRAVSYAAAVIILTVGVFLIGYYLLAHIGGRGMMM